MSVMDMIMLLDLTSERPLYRQLHDQLVEAMALGRLGPGSALPTVRRLAAELSINLHTVRRAYQLLAEEGLISLQRHNGARVLPHPQPAEEVRTRLYQRLHATAAEGLALGLSSGELDALFRRALAAISPDSMPNRL